MSRSRNKPALTPGANKVYEMAKVEGLNQRGGRFYVRIIIPGELHAAYGTTQMNLALGTGDRREAVHRATLKRAEWATAFEAKRREINPEQLPEITPEMADALAARVHAYVLSEDDRLRTDLPLLAEMVHFRRELDRRATNRLRIPNWNPPTQRIDDLTGLTPEESAELAGSNAQAEGQAAIALASRNLAYVLPVVRQQAAQLGFYFDATTPGAREALLKTLGAFRDAHRKVTQRDAGEAVQTPSMAALPTQRMTNKPRSLRDVFDRWKVSGESERSADTIASTDRALRQFEAQHPAVSLDQINRELGDLYRVWLRQGSALSSKTQRDRFTALKSLLKYAEETLQWISKHPWRGLDIKAKTKTPRRPWTPDELKAFFAAPLVTMYALPAAWNAGGEAAYWIPLMGLYTGARLGELCQLRTVDVKEVEGLAVIALTDDGEDQTIKSEAGLRTVPIHSELIRLGFLRYVASIRAAGSDALWPKLTVRKGKPSDYFGRWFRDQRRAQGLTEARPDFHCFRHTVRPVMRRAGHPEAVLDKITGHETKGSIGSVVYDLKTLEDVRPAVESIRYPFLNLPVVAP